MATTKKLDIQQDSGRLKISYNWRTGAMWFMLLWCIVWDIGIIFFLISGAGFFIIFHALAGIGVTWLTITRFLNKTTITVDRRELKLAHGPVPWPFSRDKTIPASSLKQLYVDKSNVKVNDQPTYNLQAILDTGAEVKLLGSQQDIKLVQDLEKTIETFLDIQDDTSLNLSSDGKTPAELKAMYEGVKKLREAAANRTWMPEFVKEKLANQEAMILERMQTAGQQIPGDAYAAPRPGSAAPASTPFGADGPITISTGAAQPRPLPTPDHDFDFPLYAQPEGTNLLYLDQPYRLGRTAQIDWTDEHATTGRQLELVPSGGDKLYFYAQIERERWMYYEERRLDDGEVAALGFDGNTHPLRFNNGDERYYPRDQQDGTRFLGRNGQTVEQFIYFTTSSSTQFRALKPKGRPWEVYVMEPVDAGVFEKT